MAAKSPPQQPRPACVEDYSEESQAIVPDTKTSARLSVDKIDAPAIDPIAVADRPKPAVQDERSDSGYSSHTHAARRLADAAEVISTGGQQPAPSASSVLAESQQRTYSPRPREPSHRRSSTYGASYRRYETGPGSRSRPCGCDKCLAKAGYMIVEESRSRRPAVSSSTQPRAEPPPPRPRRLPIVHHERAENGPIRGYPEHRTHAPSRPVSYHAGVVPGRAYVTDASQYYTYEQEPTVGQYYQAQPQPVYYERDPQAYTPATSQRPRPRQWASEEQRERPRSFAYDDADERRYTDRVPLVEHGSPRRDEYTSRESRAARESRAMPPPPVPSGRGYSHTRNDSHSKIRYAADSVYGSDRDVAVGNPMSRENSQQSISAMEAAGERPRRSSFARANKPSEEAVKTVTFEPVERSLARLAIDSDPVAASKQASHTSDTSPLQGSKHSNLEDWAEEYQQAAKGISRSQYSAAVTIDDTLRATTGRRRGDKTHSSDSASRRSGSNSASHLGSSHDSPAGDSLYRHSSRQYPRRPSNDILPRRDHRDAIDRERDLVAGTSSSSRYIDRGRTDSTRSASTAREKSRKRYSVMEGQGVREIDSVKVNSGRYDSSSTSPYARPSAQSLSRYSYRDEPRSTYERDRDRDRDRDREREREQTGARLVAVQHIPTSSRSRRGSRYDYDGNN